MADINAVEAQFLARGQVVVPGYLRQPGQPGQRPVSFGVFGHVLQILCHQYGALRTRPDKAHFAAQDIDQLRQFVQRRFAQQPSEAQNPPITLLRQHRTGIGLGAAHHGAQFILAEICAPFANRVFNEQDGAGVFEPDQEDAERPDRR